MKALPVGIQSFADLRENMKNKNITRRSFLKTTAIGAVGAFVAPVIVPSSVFGANAPGNRINIGAIGCGRIARDHDLPELFKADDARIMAVCDLDTKRLADAKQFVCDHYTKKSGKTCNDVLTYDNYLELLQNKDIDAVVISTPDHQHAKLAVDAVYAGKDVYLQKPLSLTIAEGRTVSNAVNSTGRIFQHGTQQRSMPQFRIACELVRNGRIGQLQTVEIRKGSDPPGGETKEMPVPANLNYDAWLGQTPWVYYTEERVHPQNDYGRPGWLRCEQFGSGAITGNVIHHLDIAHWAMGTEYTGPIEISAEAEFPAPGSGLWDVHGLFRTETLYANGVRMYCIGVSQEKPDGLLLTGTEGWIFVAYGNYNITASDQATITSQQTLQASDPKILNWKPGPDDFQIEQRAEHHLNWLSCVRSRKQPITNVEIAHRTTSACLLQHIAMKLPRKLYWDPIRERFKNDDEANTMLVRPQRFPYNI